MPQVGATQVIRFATFEVDLQAQELRKSGLRLKLSGQPFQVLAILLDQPGIVVTREELQKRLWPDTFVDVDHNLNAAINKIREALGDSSESPRFVETLPRRGYRFIAPITANEVDARARRRPSLSMLLAATAAVLAIGAFGWLAIHVRKTTSSAQPPIKSLAVLPLRNLSGNPTQEYLADGMTEALIIRLSSIHDLRVISRTTAMRYKDTKLSLPEISKVLSVDALVEGSVISENNRIRVTAQLIRGATDEHFWSETYDRELPDVLALQGDVAQAIARKVEVTITGREHERLAAAHPVVTEAYESYLKGLFSLRNSNSRAAVEQSIRELEDAIRKDPAFAPAYVALADAHSSLGTITVGGDPVREHPQVENAARKALELNPNLAEAHVLLGAMAQRQWRWAEAEAEYRRALELNPNDSDAYAELAGWLLYQGRVDEALSTAQRARELDSLGSATYSLAWILMLCRRYDESAREARSSLAVHPNHAGTLLLLGFALVLKGQPNEAIPWLEKAAVLADRSSGFIDVLAAAYARAGRRSDALRILAELKRRRQQGYVAAASFVIVYLGLGENEEAFTWLGEAYRERSNIIQFVKVHPLFDPLRGDPRFADLVRRVGLG